MSKKKLVIEVSRESYGMDVRTMTVGELMNALEFYDEDTVIVLSHDSGYTYGGIREENFREEVDVEEDELEEEEDD